MCDYHTFWKFYIKVGILIKNNIDIVSCPNCKKHMILKKGKYVAFWGWQNYPKYKGSIDYEKIRIKLVN